MSSLVRLSVTKQPSSKIIQTLGAKFMWLDITEKGLVLDNIKLRPTFIEKIKVKWVGEEDLNDIRKRAMSGEAEDVAIDSSVVLNFRGRIYVLRGDGTIEKILLKTFGLQYSIHLGVTKMY